jgi:two-component system cell cycle response regulator DivK
METPLKSYDRVRRRILIVEDNDLNQKLFKTLLEQHGYETLLTKTGVEAIKLAQDELPDLILMDDLLPGIPGLEAVRRLRDDERTKRIPIIALFGCVDERTALDGGCDAYIAARPINPRNFARTIESFLEEREHQDNRGNDRRENNSDQSKGGGK